MAVVRLSHAALALLLGFAAAVRLAPETSPASFLQNSKSARDATPLEEGAEGRRESSAEQSSSEESSREGQTLKVTDVNEAFLPLVQEGWGQWLGDPEFLEGLRIHCSDDRSFDWCKSAVAAPGRCVRTEDTLDAAGFKVGDYFEHIWLKWKLVQQYLQQDDVKDVYWFDADVAMLSNLRGCVDTEGADFMHQVEFTDQPGSLNGGQLWFRRCAAVDDYIREVMKKSSNRGKLDQWWAMEALTKVPALRTRGLPTDRFLSACWTNLTETDTDFGRACTFHANCIGGPVKKLAAMRTALKRHKAAVP